MVKLTLVEPAAIAMLAGADAIDGLLVVTPINAPPAGAGPFSVTVPVAVVPPRTEVGLNEPDASAAAATVRLTACTAVPYCAEIVATVSTATGKLRIVNVALVAPLAMVTVAGGTATPALLLLSRMTAPPLGAGPFSESVPVDEVPPRTELGFRDSVLRLAAITVSDPVWLLAPYVADTLTDVSAETGMLVTRNVAVVAFAPMVTLDGIVIAKPLLLVSVSKAPPCGAGAFRVIVPVDALPPSSDEGLKTMLLTSGGATERTAVCVLLL